MRCSLIMLGIILSVTAFVATEGGAKTVARKAPPKAAPKTAEKPNVKPNSKPAAKPAPTAPKGAAVAPGPLYQNDLEKLAPGKVPSEFMVLSGEFSVVKDGDNTVFDLPGEPVDAFGLLFGPSQKEANMAKARIHATSKGRRTPAFGVGIFGISGFKLRVTPAAKELVILKDEEAKAAVPYDWKSDTWTWVRLQARPLDKDKWIVQGRAWPDGTPEPDKWMVEWTDSEAPPSGRASILGMPYSGTPLRFDDLLMDKPLR